MTDTRSIDDDLQTEDQLLSLLRGKNYEVLMQLIDKDYRQQFCTEQSGEAFEDCVDWCAQNAGGLENAKQVLLQLFDRFYRQLPSPVRDNLAYLAEEIGYCPWRPRLSQLKERSIEGVATAKTAFNVMVKQVQDYVAEIRRRPELQVSVRFHEPSVTPAMMMRREEQFILDVQNAADPSRLDDNPCRAGGPQSDAPPDLRLSA
jgi:hypothetical protein